MNRFCAIVAVSCLSVAACSQQDATNAATYDLSLYPMCGAAEVAAESEGCVLTQEPMLHSLLVTRNDEGGIDVQVVADGEGGQRISETSQATPLGPVLADLNGDNQPDLLIPLMTGNVNTTWAVYASNPNAAYTRLGEISGIGWGPSATGLLAVPARSSAASWTINFLDVEPGGLTLIATVETAMQEAGAAPTCSLIGTPVLGAQTREEAQAQYCSDPAVAGIWTDGSPDAAGAN